MNKQQLKRVVISLLLVSSHHYTTPLPPLDPFSAVVGAGVAALGASLFGYRLCTRESTESTTDVLIGSKQVLEEEQQRHQDTLRLLKEQSEDTICRQLAHASTVPSISQALENLQKQKKKLHNLKIAEPQEESDQRLYLQHIEDLEGQFTKLESIQSSSKYKIYRASEQLTQKLPDDLEQRASLNSILTTALSRYSHKTYPLNCLVGKLEQWDQEAKRICEDAEQHRMYDIAQNMKSKRDKLQSWKATLLHSQDYTTEHSVRQQADCSERQIRIMQRSYESEREKDRELERSKIEASNRLAERELRVKEDRFNALERELRELKQVDRERVRLVSSCSRLKSEKRRLEQEKQRQGEVINRLKARLKKLDDNSNPAPEGHPPPGPVLNRPYQRPKPSAPPEPEGGPPFGPHS